MPAAALSAAVALAVAAQLSGLPTTSEVATATIADPRSSPDDATRLDFRVSLGAEWDTNANRAVSSDVQVLQGASLPGDVVSDGVTRLVAEVKGAFALAPAHALQLSYVLGAKRFFRRTTEDLLIHDLGGSTGHRLTSWLSASSWATLRASRIRSGARDYSLITAGGSVGFHPFEDVRVALSASFGRFEFEPEDRLSFDGPIAGASVSYTPIPRVTLEARFDHRWRSYSGNALVIGTGADGVQRVTYCDQVDDQLAPPACTPVHRDDTEAVITLRASYRGKVVIGGEYVGRIQRSTSELESIDRHRASIFATFLLPLELTGNVAAALQIDNGVSVTDTKYLAEDDENQNNVQVQISRMLTDALSAELRYAVFANQFTTADVSFVRQTIYLGVSYRI